MKNIFITGVAQGFGSFLVKRFTSDGYSVWGIDNLSPEQLDPEIKSILNGYWKLDLSDISSVTTEAISILEEIQPDMIIHNAAIKYYKKFADVDTDAIIRVVNVNFVSAALLTNIWLATASKPKKTCIFISSNAAYYGYSTGSLYCSTKSALRVFAQALTDEYTNQKLQVITLCPESFCNGSPGANNVHFNMDDLYRRMRKAINSGKSGELAILRYSTKLRYCYYEIKKFIKWFTEIN